MRATRRGAERARRHGSGVYRDPWFGEVSICAATATQVRFVARKSPMLDGVVMRAGKRCWSTGTTRASMPKPGWISRARGRHG